MTQTQTSMILASSFNFCFIYWDVTAGEYRYIHTESRNSTQVVRTAWKEAPGPAKLSPSSGF